ncbi:YceG-like family protein [Bacillus sp. OV322]|uniref:endolytic transglycosylase MltG n=1 Tax=Bacillus sp. OV322 TaxID=1882764 RepID=UPI0008EB571A|nr:endolytic transglycosylase MltG [Bacillus sp. OV322]SFC39229.1 YceG-like family protein [Bacillus sp. OV322]
MSRIALRAFAAGIIFACAVLSGAYYLFDQKGARGTGTQETTKLPEKNGNEEMRKPDKKQASSVKPVSPDKGKETKKQAHNVQDKTSPSSYSLEIKSGMTTEDISNLLAANKIIKDKKQFEDYMEKNHLSGRIQIGTYVLTSFMQLSQIAKTITN